MLTTEQIKNLPVAPDRSRAVAGKDTLIFVALTKDPDEFVIVGGQKNSPITEKRTVWTQRIRHQVTFPKSYPVSIHGALNMMVYGLSVILVLISAVTVSK